jgi:hypothetical protein
MLLHTFLLSCLVYSQFSLNLLVDDHQFANITKLKKGNNTKHIKFTKRKKEIEFEYLAINSNFKF